MTFRSDRPTDAVLAAFERIDWMAERDALRAPAYFRHMAAKADSFRLRGLPLDQRVASILESREAIAARLAGVHYRPDQPARQVKPGPAWGRVKLQTRRAAA
jgi:hypothetical protein